MNLFLPALRELARIYDRQIGRASLWLARRRLARTETDLGLLGWQQADFEGEAQRHIDQLMNVEREQSRQTNESAALGLAIRQGQEKRDAGKKEYEEARAALEAEWKAVAEPVEIAGRHLAARRKTDADFDRPIASLDRELAEVLARQTDLRATGSATPERHAELGRLHARAVTIPNAVADLRRRGVQARDDIRMLEETLARGQPALAAATEKLHALDEQFARSDGTLERQIAGRRREKDVLEAQIENLEKAKNNPYRQIGQVLADSGIAPMNQPGALAAVQKARRIVARIVREIAASHEASGREDRAALQKSWCLWAAAVAGIALVLLLARH